jgi:hypothetical protein
MLKPFMISDFPARFNAEHSFEKSSGSAEVLMEPVMQSRASPSIWIDIEYLRTTWVLHATDLNCVFNLA